MFASQLDVVGGGDAEMAADFPRHFGRGGGGEGEHARDFQRAAELREFQVVGPEVMPPFGNAVCFVDGHQRDVELFDTLAERLVGQPLGGDVEQLDGTGFQFFVKSAQFVHAEG